MTISDEEKRQIMNKLAQGKPGIVSQEPTNSNEENFNPEDYQNFDDFAQRSSTDERQQLLGKLQQESSNLIEQIKEEITAELEQAKQTGQLRSGRIKEIVRSAVSQVASELKSGSSDIRLIVKDAVSAVSESLKEKGGEIKEEVTASIEGVIEGISSKREQSIAKTQAEVKQLQAKLDTQEEELQGEINRLLTDIEEDGKDSPPNIKVSIEAAINALKNSEEVALMQKRYAQIQAQAAILRANLAARYGGRYEEVKEHLDEAKKWYNRTGNQAETVVDQAQQKRSPQLEETIRETREAIGKGERRIRKLLSELLKTAAELLREKEEPSK